MNVTEEMVQKGLDEGEFVFSGSDSLEVYKRNRHLLTYTLMTEEPTPDPETWWDDIVGDSSLKRFANRVYERDLAELWLDKPEELKKHINTHLSA